MKICDTLNFNIKNVKLFLFLFEKIIFKMQLITTFCRISTLRAACLIYLSAGDSFFKLFVSS